jgi:hypothetical protein
MVEKLNGKGVKSAVGVLSAVVSIVSVWWFALRPRRMKRDK